MELDFYIENYSAAIEVQGEQHHRPVKFFNPTQESYEAQLKRDRMKEMICAERGITLYRLYKYDDVFEIIGSIKSGEVKTKVGAKRPVENSLDPDRVSRMARTKMKRILKKLGSGNEEGAAQDIDSLVRKMMKNKGMSGYDITAKDIVNSKEYREVVYGKPVVKQPSRDKLPEDFLYEE